MKNLIEIMDEKLFAMRDGMWLDVLGKENAVKEIHEHYMKFIEWKDAFTEYDIIKGLYEVCIETHVIEKMTLEKLYQHYCNEILKFEP